MQDLQKMCLQGVWTAEVGDSRQMPHSSEGVVEEAETRLWAKKVVRDGKDMVVDDLPVISCREVSGLIDLLSVVGS